MLRWVGENLPYRSFYVMLCQNDNETLDDIADLDADILLAKSFASHIAIQDGDEFIPGTRFFSNSNTNPVGAYVQLTTNIYLKECGGKRFSLAGERGQRFDVDSVEFLGLRMGIEDQYYFPNEDDNLFHDLFVSL